MVSKTDPHGRILGFLDSEENLESKKMYDIIILRPLKTEH
jgi:hypothetical protein